MRHLGKGQFVTAQYNIGQVVRVASMGDQFSVRDLKIDREEGVLYVGFRGDLSGDAEALVQYDLRHWSALTEISVEPTELRHCDK
jgi:hypothetical protein